MRIRNVYPGSWFLFHPDPTTATKKVKYNFFPYLYCSQKYNKIKIYFICELQYRVLFTKKLSLSSQKYMFRIQGPKKEPDPGSATLVSTYLNLKTSLCHDVISIVNLEDEVRVRILSFYLSKSAESVREKLEFWYKACGPIKKIRTLCLY